MKRFCIVFLLLAFDLLSYAQPVVVRAVQFTLYDSISISEPSFVKLLHTARIIGFNEAFIVLNRNKTHLLFDKYDYRGTKVLSQMYELDTTYNNVLISYVNGNQLLGYSDGYVSINILDKELKFRRRIPVPLEQFEREKYAINFYGFYDIKSFIFDNWLITPVSKVYQEQRGRKYYKAWDYMAGIFQISSNNELVPYMLIGKIDSNLKKQGAYFLYEYPKITYDMLNKKVLFCSEFSDQIQQWTLDSALKKPVFFGKRGKYMKNNCIKEQKTSDIFNKHFSNYFHYRIENDLYENIFYDSVHKFVCRTYRPAIKDTIYNRKEFKKNSTNDNTRMQVHLEQSKPYGLQIYNEKYELIFDEIMPTPFNILKIENNEIWVHGRYDEATQKYWIYKYKIDYSQP